MKNDMLDLYYKLKAEEERISKLTFNEIYLEVNETRSESLSMDEVQFETCKIKFRSNRLKELNS